MTVRNKAQRVILSSNGTDLAHHTYSTYSSLDIYLPLDLSQTLPQAMSLSQIIFSWFM